jgi:phenylpyruvate tautomerase PptA (4-oxalocrotonate tautomerase family)
VPFLQVHTTRDISAVAKHALGAALATAYGDVMQTSARIVNVGFVQYGAGDLGRYDASGGAPREMAVVTCDVRDGRTPAQHESLGRTIAALCSATLGLPEDRIAVYLTEHASHHIYRDGARAPAWTPSEAGARPGRADT